MKVGQKLYNSNSSDTDIVVWPQGVDVPDTRVVLTPGGDSYKVLEEDMGKLRVVVEGSRFRAKKDGGSWGSWQDLPAGSKEFTPGDSKTTYWQTEL
jgi:hypothetical protein